MPGGIVPTWQRLAAVGGERRSTGNSLRSGRFIETAVSENPSSHASLYRTPVSILSRPAGRGRSRGRIADAYLCSSGKACPSGNSRLALDGPRIGPQYPSRPFGRALLLEPGNAAIN